MTPEEVALRYARARAGYELVGYAEVGLPVYEINIQADTLAYKRISPLDEFTLKAVSAGLTLIEDISSFLGINTRVAESVLSGLIHSDDLALAAALGDLSQSLRLTPKGRRTIEEAEITVPEERTFQVHFDGLLRAPLLIREYLYSPKDLRDHELLEIPTIPSTRPELEDLKVEAVQEIVRKAGRHTKETRRDILSIKSIVKRYRKFRPGVALKYRSPQGDTVVAFAIDGRLSEEHERAFARGNGLEKLKLKPSGEDPFEEITKGIGEYLKRSPFPEEEVTKRKIAYEQSAAALARAREEAKTAIISPKPDAEERLRQASQDYEEAAAALAAVPVLSLSVYEHPPVLEEALEKAKERLMIVSPWIHSRVVDRSFLDKLERLLKRNVDVYIGYGFGDNKIDQGALKRLKGLADKYACFRLEDFGNTHAKLLLYDKACVVLGSFNWLSFKGDPNATFRDEQGFLVRIPEVIEEKFNEQVARFTEKH